MNLHGVYYKGEIRFGELRYSFKGMKCRKFNWTLVGRLWSDTAE